MKIRKFRAPVNFYFRFLKQKINDDPAILKLCNISKILADVKNSFFWIELP